MRITLIVFGVTALFFYAVSGTLLMNDWAVVAASGEPLDQTIIKMNNAQQNYSAIPGFIFAILGGIFALAWAWLTFRSQTTPKWALLTIWAAILACGAPAYFFASFGNLNSVGDTYADWDFEAVSALEAPLFSTSGIAALIAIATLIATGIRAVITTRRPYTTV